MLRYLGRGAGGEGEVGALEWGRRNKMTLGGNEPRQGEWSVRLTPAQETKRKSSESRGSGSRV